MREKVFFGGLELLRPAVVTAAKMPRAAVIGVVRDRATGFLNAAPYSGMVIHTAPLHILFGVKSQASVDAYRDAEEFCVAIANRNQVDHVWVMALTVPRGINEIELTGWHELQPRTISTPGIEECLINFECRKIHFHELPHSWRAVVVGEVVGVHVDTSLLEMSRADTARLLPIHEAGTNVETGYYGPSTLSGELIPSASTIAQRITAPSPAPARTFLSGADFSDPTKSRVLARAILPRPCYIVTACESGGESSVSTICGGGLGSTPPALQIPIEKKGELYRIIKKTNEFVVSIPDRSLIPNYEQLERDHGAGIEKAGMSRLRPNMVNISGIAECPVNIDCKTVIMDDIPDSEYALLVGRSIGISLDEDVYRRLNVRLPTADSIRCANEVYSGFFYSVMDDGMTGKWAFQDVNNLSVRPLPSWGSRHGGWWGYGRNPSLNLWLLELVEESLLTEREMAKITHCIRVWNNGVGPWHLHEFFDKKTSEEMRGRLQTVLKMMAWAHRDFIKWDEVKEYLCSFPAVERDQHDGPLFHEKWNEKRESGMGFVW